jgi:hypothetical protein
MPLGIKYKEVYSGEERERQVGSATNFVGSALRYSSYLSLLTLRLPTTRCT